MQEMLRNEIFKVGTSDEKYGAKWKKFIYVRVIDVRSHNLSPDIDVPTEEFMVDLKAIDENSTDCFYPITITLQNFIDMLHDEELCAIDDGDKAYIILRYRAF